MLAQEAAFQLGLDRVLLVPVGESPYKRIDPEPGAEVRLEMTRLAAAADELIEASDVETGRAGPSFSFRTLELLTDARPTELARLGIVSRAGTAAEEAEAAVERLSGADRAEIVRMPEIGVSSTGIRRRVAAGRPIRHLVPDAVVGLILERGLYRA